jgi:hypothetical protein
MDSAQHPSLPPEGDSPICPRCRLPLQAREDGDGGQWTHQCLECGQVYTVGERVKMLRPRDDKQLRPSDTGPAVGGAKTEGERE